MFKAVQNELAERQENIKKYVGTNMITRKLVCGKCDGVMRRKLYHSTDKYKSFRYRCTNRYEGTRDCDMRIIKMVKLKQKHLRKK